MLFSELPIDHRIVKNLTIMQLANLTDIQQQAIPHALLNKDIIAASKTGSGKTLAFVVPMVHRLLTQRSLSKADPRALILAPTRELAKQVFGVVRQVIANTQLQANLIVGGENYNDQAKLLRRNPHIVVGTAGRIADHLKDKQVFLNGLELLILDEADRMLELGFSEQLAQIHRQADHRKRQTMMFSATIEQAQVKQMTQELLNAPQKIVVDSSHQPHKDIEQRFYLSDGVSQKDTQLTKLISIKEQEQAIVFTATREDTQRLCGMLSEAGFNAVALSGDLLQQQRNQILSDFSQGKFSVLVTTDLAARGLDIRNVALVINYDLPKFPEEYIHRIGRTGRAGNTGLALSIVGKKDWKSFESIKANYINDAEFLSIEGIETQFKGIKKVVAKKAKVNKAKPAAAQNSGNKKAPKKRFNNADSVELGNIPIKRKARTSNLDDSIDED
ncbi:DEAD/DEAH box helicase [Glaciecola sp. 2405UD65-10]|uniref:DEAD/DEAH box helicase n=1 Tax=Glaciecola sp. 2405UD65-10 TaxID=3397244 RepID=UPI003B5AF288